MANTPNLSLPFLAADQAQKHVTVNESLSLLDGLVQLTVIDRTTSTPPTGVEGLRYIVAATATDAWVGQENNVALFINGAWSFFTPDSGWLAYDQATATYVRWNGTTWVNAFPASGGSFGIHDYQDTATGVTPIALTAANTWYDLTNDGLGPLTDNTFAISGHGEIWDTATDTFDFSSLQLGDMLRIRTDVTFTTSGANHVVDTRLVFGPSYAYSLNFDSQKEIKSAGSVQRVKYFSFQMKSLDTLNNPAKFQVRSSATGDVVSAEGWQIETHLP